jgi:hypothetical protein
MIVDISVEYPTPHILPHSSPHTKSLYCVVADILELKVL